MKTDDYKCGHMTAIGCKRMDAAKNYILKMIQEGSDEEPCTKECCIACDDIFCPVYCGRAHWDEASRLLTEEQEIEILAGLRCRECYKELNNGYVEVRKNGAVKFYCNDCYEKIK